MKHYVYRHIRLDTYTPFYVGKGGYKQRAYTMTQRNDYWTNIKNKAGVKVEVLKYFNTNEEAYAFEQQLIKLYKKLGYCEANFSDGGAGRTGFKQPDYVKKIISEKNSGARNGMYGARGSEVKSYGTGFRIKCLNTGKSYISTDAAEKELDISNVTKVVLGYRNSTYNYHFEFENPLLRAAANVMRAKRIFESKKPRKSDLEILINIYKISNGKKEGVI